MTFSVAAVDREPPWRVFIYCLCGRSWHSGAVSVFTHVTVVPAPRYWRVTNVGAGVSGLWWVSDILRGMSLEGLVAQVGQVLGDARGLYGAAPQGGGWSSTQALSAGRDGIAAAGGVVAGWGGAASSTYLAASGGRVLALDNVIGADGATGPGFGGAADTSQYGRNGMTGVVDDTRRGVAAIAPSTDTPAGKRQLVDHLQSELDRAKSLLKVSEQRNVMLAQLIRGGAGGYGGAGSRMGGGGMSPMMGGMPGMGAMSPMSLGGGMGSIPNLSSLSSLLGDGRRGRDRAARPGLTLHPPVPTGSGADAFRAAIRRGLTIKGITDPLARANWEAGMMVVGDRESDFNNTAVNGEDRNAGEGNHSAGILQFTRTTFEAYHEPGTSADRGDNVAQVCAFVNYAMGHYGVSADGSDLAAKIQQVDPTRPAKGY
jgi:hypothetical protein